MSKQEAVHSHLLRVKIGVRRLQESLADPAIDEKVDILLLHARLFQGVADRAEDERARLLTLLFVSYVPGLGPRGAEEPAHDTLVGLHKEDGRLGAVLGQHLQHVIVCDNLRGDPHPNGLDLHLCLGRTIR